MENKIILEEILRAKLLMGYSPSKTLTENTLLVNNNTETPIIIEQTSRAFLKALFGGSERAVIDAARAAGKAEYRAARTMFDDVIRNFGGVRASNARGGILKTADEVIEALINKTMTGPEISNLAKNMLKSGQLTGDLRTLLIKRAANLTKKDARFAGMTTKEIERSLVKKGYPKDISRSIAKEVEALGGATGVVAKKGTTTSKSTYGSVKSKSDFQKWRQSVGESWKKLTLWQKIKRIAIAGAGIGLLYWFFKEEEPGLFPDCLLLKMTDDDLKKMGEGQIDGIIISKTGIRELDINGGVKLFANKKCESVNGNFEGKWEESGNQISITIGGRKILIPCSSTQGGGNGGDKVSNYYECTTEPFRLYCKNDTYIGKLQECLNKNGAGLNVDGDFGPKTLEALTKVKGYEQFDGNSELKISEIDKICGIVSTGTDSNQEGSTSTGEINKPRIGTFNPIPEG
jgi:hypothetical protein